MRLSNGDFLSQVSTLLSNNDGMSSVYFTQKRLAANVENETTDADMASNVVPHPDSFAQNEQKYPVLIRVTRGEKSSKMSTVVEVEHLDAFWRKYSKVLREGFVGLDSKTKKKLRKRKA